MILTEDIKNKITKEYEAWEAKQYGNTTKEERKKLSAVFTPPKITIKILEKITEITPEKTIFDPCCGSGNLLAAAVIAGANPNNVYGNEYNAEFVEIARERLSKLGVPSDNIQQGDATVASNLTLESFKDLSKHKKPVELKQVSLWDL